MIQRKQQRDLRKERVGVLNKLAHGVIAPSRSPLPMRSETIVDAKPSQPSSPIKQVVGNEKKTNLVEPAAIVKKSDNPAPETVDLGPIKAPVKDESPLPDLPHQEDAAPPEINDKRIPRLTKKKPVTQEERAIEFISKRAEEEIQKNGHLPPGSGVSMIAPSMIRPPATKPPALNKSTITEPTLSKNEPTPLSSAPPTPPETTSNQTPSDIPGPLPKFPTAPPAMELSDAKVADSRRQLEDALKQVAAQANHEAGDEVKPAAEEVHLPDEVPTDAPLPTPPAVTVPEERPAFVQAPAPLPKEDKEEAAPVVEAPKPAPAAEPQVKPEPPKAITWGKAVPVPNTASATKRSRSMEEAREELESISELKQAVTKKADFTVDEAKQELSAIVKEKGQWSKFGQPKTIEPAKESTIEAPKPASKAEPKPAASADAALELAELIKKGPPKTVPPTQVVPAAPKSPPPAPGLSFAREVLKEAIPMPAPLPPPPAVANAATTSGSPAPQTLPKFEQTKSDPGPVKPTDPPMVVRASATAPAPTPSTTPATSTKYAPKRWSKASATMGKPQVEETNSEEALPSLAPLPAGETLPSPGEPELAPLPEAGTRAK